MENAQAVITSLENAPRIIVPLVSEVPSEILKRRPAPGKWSAHEHACHLAVVHKLFLPRLDLMLYDPHPQITPYQPAQDESEEHLLQMDLGEAMNRFVYDRAALVERVRALRPDDWARTAKHPEYTLYSVLIMFRHLALHDFSHAYRIEELMLKNDWD